MQFTFMIINKLQKLLFYLLSGSLVLLRVLHYLRFFLLWRLTKFHVHIWARWLVILCKFIDMNHYQFHDFNFCLKHEKSSPQQLSSQNRVIFIFHLFYLLLLFFLFFLVISYCCCFSRSLHLESNLFSLNYCPYNSFDSLFLIFMFVCHIERLFLEHVCITCNSCHSFCGS